MDRRPLLSIPLSIAIVGFFALALYQPARKPPPAGAETAARAAPPATRAGLERPRGAVDFTVVRVGETLEDVAERVYGQRAAAPAIVRANRDVLARGVAALEAGALLRTPPLGSPYSPLRK